MTDKEPDPLQRIEDQTRTETDFGAYVRFLAKEELPGLLETENPDESEQVRARRMRLLIGFTTLRVLKNREKAGLPNEVDSLWGDPGLRSWIQEFIVDDQAKLLMGQGIIQGFEIAGLLPKNWRDSFSG